MTPREHIERLAACTTVAETQQVERRAFGGRRWSQADADLIRLAAIAKRVELTRSHDCHTVTIRKRNGRARASNS